MYATARRQTALPRSNERGPAGGGVVEELSEIRGAAARDDLAVLLTRVGQDRDRDAFRQVFDHFAPRVRNFLLGRRVDPAKADELAQEVMLSVWRRAQTYDPDRASPATWIFTVARNLHIDHFRRVRRRERLEPHENEAMVEDGPSADDLLSRSDDVKAVVAALERLPEDQKEVLVLSFREGHSHPEIAERLSLPLGTVKSRIRLALGRMRNMLGDER